MKLLKSATSRMGVDGSIPKTILEYLGVHHSCFLKSRNQRLFEAKSELINPPLKGFAGSPEARSVRVPPQCQVR
jgi:hypothetical protein